MHRVIIATLGLAITAAAADLPLFFEPNQGQSQPGVEFLSRGNGVTSNLNASAAEFPIGNSTVRMELIGATSGKGEGLDRLPGLSSYFSGNDSSQWHTRIPQFGRVRYRNVYPGVDLVYYGNHGKLEYDFVIAPGAKPSAIHLTYRGLDRVRIDRSGSLVLQTASGEIRQRKPVVYQESNGKRVEIAASYRLSRGNQVGFELGRFDARLPLVVDPVLEYGTYFGGGWTSDMGVSAMQSVQSDAAGNLYMAGTVNPGGSTPGGTANLVKFSPSQNQVLYWTTYAIGAGFQNVIMPSSLAIDSQGYAYICGMTPHTNIPTVNAFQSKNNSQYGNGFVAKFSPDGQSLVYSTYLGGSQQTWLYGIAVDSSGDAFVTGFTDAFDYPVLNAAQPTNKTATNMFANGEQAILAQFSPSGTLLFSTYFGGSGGNTGTTVVVDSTGSPILVGNAFTNTLSTDFPTTPGAYQSALPSTECAFAAKFTPSGQLVYSTLFGGDYTLSTTAALDSQNDLYLGGLAMKDTLPLVNALMPQWPGASNTFIAKLSADGSRLLYSTYLGGNSFDTLSAIAVDSTGNIYAAGFTTSPNFPVKNSLVAFPAASGSPFSWLSYGFLTKIGPDGQSLVYSTLIGGSHGYDLVWGMAFAPSGGVYLIGGTDDADFPTMNAFQGTIGGVGPSGIPSSYGDNVFLVRIDDGPGDTATPYTQAPMANLTASPNFQMFTLAQNGSMGTAAFSVTSSAAATAFAARASVMPTYVNGALTSSNWLSVTPTSGTAPARLTMTADPTGMPVGLYNGTISVTPASGAPATVGVTMLVSPSGFTVTLSAAPSSLAFSAPQNGAAASQTVTLNSSAAPTSFNLAVSTASGGNWLSASPSNGIAPAQVTVSVNPQGLAAGTYSGSILATPSDGTAIGVPVTLTVTSSSTGAASPAIGSVNPSSLVGNQQDQVVTVTGSGFSSQTVATLVLDGFEFPAKLTPVSFVNSSTLNVTVRGIFLFQPDSLGLRLTNPGAAESAAFAIPIH
jgi:hypothetical protein